MQVTAKSFKKLSLLEIPLKKLAIPLYNYIFPNETINDSFFVGGYSVLKIEGKHLISYIKTEDIFL
jgi:hypothetical protein